MNGDRAFDNLVDEIISVFELSGLIRLENWRFQVCFEWFWFTILRRNCTKIRGREGIVLVKFFLIILKIFQDHFMRFWVVVNHLCYRLNSFAGFVLDPLSLKFWVDRDDRLGLRYGISNHGLVFSLFEVLSRSLGSSLVVCWFFLDFSFDIRACAYVDVVSRILLWSRLPASLPWAIWALG